MHKVQGVQFRLIATFAITATAVCAQVISITAPSANQITSGFQFRLGSTCPSCISLYSIEYDVDGELAGISRTPPYSFVWNTFYAPNGSHTITATARKIDNSLIATSSPVRFNVENNLPQNTCGTTCSDISVTGPEFTSVVNIGFGSDITMQMLGFTGSASIGTPCNAFASSVSCTVGTQYAVFGRVQGNGTVTISDGVTTFTCTNSLVDGTDNNFTTRWCGTVSGTAGTRTFSVSGGTGGYLIYVIPVSGATTLDTAISSADAIALGTTGMSTGFVPTPTELVLAGSSWDSVTSFTPGIGWTQVSAESSNESIVMSRLFTNLNIFGRTYYSVLTHGVPTASKDTYLYVDGILAATCLVSGGCTAGNTSTAGVSVDTTRYSNAPHQVVISQFNEANCTGCLNGIWTWIGGWEQTETFSNPVVPSYLAASATEIVLTPTGSANNCIGGSSCTLTGTLVNTDGSSSAATISSCVSSDRTVFTVSGTCTLTQVGLGAATNTMTDSTGRTRSTEVLVMTSNVVPHFEKDGTVSTSPWDSNSIYHASQFFTAGAAASGYAPSYTNAQFFLDYAAAGFNAFEVQSDNGVGYATPGESEATWDAAVAASISSVASVARQYHMYVHLLSDDFFGGTPNLFGSQYGQCSSFSTPCFQYIIQQWKNAGVVLGHSGSDEVSSAWNALPLQGVAAGGLLGGTYWGGITGNGSTCQFTGVSPSISVNGAHYFLIVSSSSGQPNLYFNPTTNANLFQYNTNTITNSGSFPCSFNGTYSATSNDRIEPYVAQTFSSSYVGCPGSGGGPCPLYIKSDVFKSIRTQLTNISSYPAMAWPPVSGCTGACFSTWGGKVSVVPFGGSQAMTMADYAEQYWTTSGAAYLPEKTNLQSVYGGANMVATYYANAPAINLSAPYVWQTQGTTTNYAFTGYQVPIASCSGNTITFSSPHNLSTVNIGVSRIWIQNASMSSCNIAPTTLNGSISSSATSFVLTSATGFSAPGIFYFNDSTPEAVFCTTLVGTTVSGCARAINSLGQASQSHSNGAAIQEYFWGWITATPTATTMTIASPIVSAADYTGTGTMLFDDGHSFPVSSVPGEGLGTANLYPNGNYSNMYTSSGGCPDPFSSEKGHYFTVSGADAYFNSHTFYYNWDLGVTCNISQNHFWEAPNWTLSAAQTATIAADNNYIRGRNWAGNSEMGSTLMFTYSILPFLLRGSGIRNYGFGETPQFYSTIPTANSNGGFNGDAIGFSRTFMNFDLGGVSGGNQAHINPRWDYARTLEGWSAVASANLISQRLIKYAYQAEMPAPDYGEFFYTNARTGTYGNLLMIQSLADGPLSLTANLSPYLISGQSILRECATWQGPESVVSLAAGTTSDTPTYKPGEFCAYIFPTNVAAEYAPPTISVNMSDISGATQVMVQFASTPMPFSAPSVKSQMLFNTVGCVAGTCVLPVDTKVGPVFYRFLFLNPDDVLLATSDVQTIGQTQ